MAVGSTAISASLGSVSSTPATMTVTAATLVSIAITPPTPSIVLGTSEQFTAIGTYSDNSTQDLTPQVTWTSATASVASISNASGNPGHATSTAVGSSVISASLGAVAATPVTMTVTAATLVSIAITPPTLSFALGTTQQFTATGTYTDNSTQNLTSQVTWTSATPSVASISNGSGTQGFATTMAVGSSAISASLGAVTATPVTMTVTAATLVSIAVTPPTPTNALGTTQQFTATGTYTG